jgi:hypothetical protein
MFGHVGVDQKKQNTSVEKLGNENTVRDLGESFTVGIVSD